MHTWSVDFQQSFSNRFHMSFESILFFRQPSNTASELSKNTDVKYDHQANF